jgi:uncharacterized protein (TIRG00374 family)
MKLSRRVLFLIVKIGVSTALMALLLSRTDLDRLWSRVRMASVGWLLTALALYFVMVLASAWRWGLLLHAQHVAISTRRLLGSFLVATFFNNFLPSNIGGDVIRVRDTAGPARSLTLATTIVLIDRGIGLLGLGLVAAIGATAAGGNSGPVLPSVLWVGLLLACALSVPAVLAPAGVGWILQPLRIFHAEWVGERITRVTDALAKFRNRPQALGGCFLGAVLVQAVLVAFYAAIVRSMNIPVSFWHLAVIVPITFIVQMVPLSVNGFGVREATFSFYFARLGLPLDSAITVSLMGAGLVMLFSLSGAAVYVARGHGGEAVAPNA